MRCRSLHRSVLAIGAGLFGIFLRILVGILVYAHGLDTMPRHVRMVNLGVGLRVPALRRWCVVILLGRFRLVFSC